MRRLTDRLLYWILLAGVCGYLLPGPAEVSEFLVPGLLFAMVLGLGLTLSPGDFRGALRWRSVAPAVGLQLIILPIAAAGLRLVFPPGPLRDGTLLLGLAPAEITSALMAGLAGGDLALSATLLVLSMAVSLLVIPLAAGFSAAGALAAELLLTVLLPLGLGILVRASVWRARREACEGLSAAAVLGLVFIACAPLRAVGVAALARLAGAALTMTVVGFGSGALTGKIAGLANAQRVSLAFFGGMREFGVAAAVALSASPSGAAIPAAVYGPVMMLVAGAVASRLQRRTSRASTGEPTPEVVDSRLQQDLPR